MLPHTQLDWNVHETLETTPSQSTQTQTQDLFGQEWTDDKKYSLEWTGKDPALNTHYSIIDSREHPGFSFNPHGETLCRYLCLLGVSIYACQ